MIFIMKSTGWTMFVAILGFQVSFLTSHPLFKNYSTVPKKCELDMVMCLESDAVVFWKNEKNAEIFQYVIEYNTSYNPNLWTPVYDYITGNENEYNVAMAPWTNYTFRVIAVNYYGRSEPSDTSNMCTSPPAPPTKNPTNVTVVINQYKSLFVSWSAMEVKDHAGPGFKYQIYWRQDTNGCGYHKHIVDDWRQNQVLIPSVSELHEYRVKILAVNEIGECAEYPVTTITDNGKYKEIPAYQPRFKWIFVDQDGNLTFRIQLIQDKNGQNFNFFYVQYKTFNDERFTKTPYCERKQKVTVTFLDREVYTVKVTAVDGEYHVTSRKQIIDTNQKYTEDKPVVPPAKLPLDAAIPLSNITKKVGKQNTSTSTGQPIEKVKPLDVTLENKTKEALPREGSVANKTKETAFVIHDNTTTTLDNETNETATDDLLDTSKETINEQVEDSITEIPCIYFAKAEMITEKIVDAQKIAYKSESSSIVVMLVLIFVLLIGFCAMHAGLIYYVIVKRAEVRRQDQEEHLYEVPYYHARWDPPSDHYVTMHPPR